MRKISTLKLSSTSNRLPWITNHTPEVLTTLGLLLALELASRGGLVDPRTIPPISRILGELIQLGRDPLFWVSVGDTLFTWAVGLAISAGVGIPLGMLIAASTFGFRSTQFVIDFLRTIPPVMMVPIALLIFGPTLEMSLLLIVQGCVWLIVLQTIQGLRQLEPGIRETATAFRLSWWHRTKEVILPSAAPFISTGIRISVTVSLLLAIGAEVIGGAPGLGNAIALAQQGTQVDRMYALVAVCAVLGVLMNMIYERIEREVLSWHPFYRKEMHE